MIKDASCHQPVAAKVSALGNMIVFVPLLINLAFLILVAASPRNKPLKMSAFTSTLSALTLKTQRLMPKWAAVLAEESIDGRPIGWAAIGWVQDLRGSRHRLRQEKSFRTLLMALILKM